MSWLSRILKSVEKRAKEAVIEEVSHIVEDTIGDLLKQGRTLALAQRVLLDLLEAEILRKAGRLDAANGKLALLAHDLEAAVRQ